MSIFKFSRGIPVLPYPFRNAQAIERAMKLLGWWVYATNQLTAAAGLAQAVEAYSER